MSIAIQAIDTAGTERRNKILTWNPECWKFSKTSSAVVSGESTEKKTANRAKNGIELLSGFFNSSSGWAQALKFAHKTIDLIRLGDLPTSSQEGLANASRALGMARAVSGFAKLAKEVQGISNAIEKKVSLFEFSKTAVELLEAIGMTYQTIAGFVGSSHKIDQLTVNGISLVSDVFDVVDSSKKIAENQKFLEAEKSNQNNLKVVTVFTETRDVNIIKLVKCVIAVALGVFVLLGVILGGPVIPLAAILVMGIATAALSTTAYFYENTRPLAWETVTPQPVTSQAVTPQTVTPQAAQL